MRPLKIDRFLHENHHLLLLMKPGNKIHLNAAFNSNFMSCWIFTQITMYVLLLKMFVFYLFEAIRPIRLEPISDIRDIWQTSRSH